MQFYVCPKCGDTEPVQPGNNGTCSSSVTVHEKVLNAARYMVDQGFNAATTRENAARYLPSEQHNRLDPRDWDAVLSTAIALSGGGGGHLLDR